ncbi:hypothetical protein C8J57DRAFT_1375557, partial [Mycena rebaudengoi]
MLVPAPLPVNPVLLFLAPFFCLNPCTHGAETHCLPQNSINLLAVQSFFPSESLAFDRGPRVCTEARGPSIGG